MKYFLAGTILLLTGYAVNSQTAPDFSDSAIVARFKHDISILASDSLEGRNSGTEGEWMAYEYLIRQFTEAGLEPKGADSSWLQPFPYVERERAKDKKLVISGRECRDYYDYGLVGFSGSGAASGAVVDVGSGISLAACGVDDYAGLDVTGKIVLIDLWVPGKWIRNDSTTRQVRARSRALTAFSKGAAGVLFHNPNSRYGLRTPGESILDTTPGPVLYVTGDVVSEIRRSEQHTAEMETKFSVKRSTYHNIAGYIDNGAPYTVILGAHYDHVGIGTKTGLVRNGADDNASGTAMITELARYYRSHPSGKYNFLVIAYSGEEEGLKGSYWYAAHPTIDFSTVSFVFNFDMVGRLGCQGNRVDAVCTATSPEWNKILRKAPGRDFRVRKIPGAGEFSDHYPFYLHNLPIAYLTTGMHYDYHTSRDDSWKINYTGMVGICNYSKGIISECEKRGKIPFKKVSGWTNARSMLYYIGEQLDYVLTVGMREAE